jgi:anti-anti-sigma factor
MFKSESKNGLLILKVELKRATFKDSDQFKSYFEEELKNKYLGVIIDLSKCEFIDSAFLGTILYASKLISNSGAQLKLVACHVDTEALLDLTGISKLLRVYESLSEAETSFKIS